MVSLQQFRTLHSVRSHGGIHAAAKALHLSPSAVSQQIKALGSECGFPLVEPDGRGIKLTEDGSRIAQIASQIADLWESSVSHRSADGAMAVARRRCVKVGAFPSALVRCVLPAISCSGDLPFDMHLFETAPYEGRRLVGEGVLEAAVSLQETGEEPRDLLRVVPLRHDPFLFVGPPDLISAVTRPGAGQPLSAMRWVLPRAGSDCDRLIATHFARHKITARPVGRTDDWVLAQEMAIALNALAFVPSSALATRSDLARCLQAGEIPAPARTVVLVAEAAAAATGWFTVLQQRLQQAYTRTAGVAYGT
ncbi:LysR family transcriptional regulator [Streptomyces sp. Rer75]|uniref:LysR family transcriptional regulator n=1 Tax=Streptomyces sp. Rer75 TaxID=2750011 RepID=UPI0015D049FC|nr:LysR family transcriptional regulator [Streptomyces sp. Rer75]QLH26584.1 LysR family transcriptional regulator [Streptomyces sp. Rer75]